MNKIPEEYLKDYVQELGEFEKEHRRGGTFYCTASYTFKQDDIDTLEKEGVDASAFLNVCVSLSGIYDDDWGCDWNSVDYYKVEEYQELVPEQIIEAHYVTKYKSEAFDPVWE